MRSRLASLLFAGLTLAATSLMAGAPIVVGPNGNEPLITAAPDGTLYISALQYLYKSTDRGATWQAVTTPIFASTLELASDSSIWVDPGGRLYFSFDYPYAGATAVCTSDDRGVSWTCNPAVVPGGTDRMWVSAPTNSAAYVVTNEGLYQTVFLVSTDRGLTWVPSAVANLQLEPQTGQLIQKPGSQLVLQPFKTADNGLQMYVYAPSQAGTIISSIHSTTLPNSYALPNAWFAADNMLWIASEEPNSNVPPGRQVVLARSADEGTTFTKLPPIPETTTGTAVFTWVAAGSAGHVGVIYYYTTENVEDSLNATTPWMVKWAESRNANSANPTWTVTTLEENVHTGPLCIALGCDGTNRFAGDFISSIFFQDVAYLTWMTEDAVHFTSIAAPPAATLSLSSSAVSVSESAGTATVTVVRAGSSAGTVGVHYATSDGSATAGSDYTATSGDLTFAAGEMSKTITIPINDDTAVEPDETFTLTLTAPTGGASVITPAAATVNITNNDSATSPAISGINPSSVCPGSGLTTVVVTGSNFTATSVVQFDGAGRDTTFVGPTELRVNLPASDLASPRTAALRVVDGANTSNSAAFTVRADSVPPAVTAPSAIFVDQTMCAANSSGASGSTSPALSDFLRGGSAVDDCSASTTSLAPQANGHDVMDASFFRIGETVVTFRFRDAAGNVGTATSKVTVRGLLDVTADNAVDAVDLVVLANYLVGNVQVGTAPFNAPPSAADVNRDADINAVDLVVAANYLVGNIDCLAK